MQTEAIFGLTLDNIVVFLLSTFRVGGLFVAAPVFGQTTVPVQVKIMLTLMFGYFLFPLVGTQTFQLDPGLLPLVLLGAKEFMFGLIIGFLFQLIFLGVQFGGGVLGYQIGYAMVNVIDPSTSESVPIIGQLKLILSTLIFFIIDGHHVILQALFESYKVVPLGHVSFNPLAMDAVMHASAAVFVVGIKIAAPVLVTLFITDICLGIVARTMPQMNILIVGFQVKIGAGLIMLALGLPFFQFMFTKVFNQLSIDAFTITKGFAG